SISPAASPTGSVATMPVAAASATSVATNTSTLPTTTASAAPMSEASAAPIAQASTAPSAGSPEAPASSISKPIPAANTTPSASSPATNPPSTQEQSSSSAVADLVDRFSRPGNLFVALLLLLGILFLIWIVVQQARRNLVGVYDSSSPLTEPSFLGDD